MNNTKPTLTSKQKEFPTISMVQKFGSIKGKLQFLANLDLGSITKNETANELLEDIDVLQALVEAVENKLR